MRKIYLFDYKKLSILEDKINNTSEFNIKKTNSVSELIEVFKDEICNCESNENLVVFNDLFCKVNRGTNSNYINCFKEPISSNKLVSVGLNNKLYDKIQQLINSSNNFSIINKSEIIANNIESNCVYVDLQETYCLVNEYKNQSICNIGKINIGFNDLLQHLSEKFKVSVKVIRKMLEKYGDVSKCVENNFLININSKSITVKVSYKEFINEIQEFFRFIFKNIFKNINSNITFYFDGFLSEITNLDKFIRDIFEIEIKYFDNGIVKSLENYKNFFPKILNIIEEEPINNEQENVVEISQESHNYESRHTIIELKKRVRNVFSLNNKRDFKEIISSLFETTEEVVF